AKYQRIFVLNDPHALRISADLAVEIGFNESILLLQLEFLLSIVADKPDHWKNDRLWTRQSGTDWQGYFKWLSLPTISRALDSLEKQGLISIDNFNKYKYDRSQWFALNYDGLSKLKSIRVSEVKNPFFKMK